MPPTRSASGLLTGSPFSPSGLLIGAPSSAAAGTHERLYVANGHGSGSVSVIDTGSRKGDNQPGAAIRLARTGASPNADARGGPVIITRDGRWLFAVDPEANAVVPIDIATGRPGPPIAVGPYPVAVALGP